MSTVHRVEVRPRPGLRDPRGERVQREMAGAGPGAAPRRVDHASVYLLRGQLTADQVQRITRELLADPVTEEAGTARPTPTGTATVEVHPLPCVMDPAAESVQLAVRSMLGVDVEVRTGSRWDLEGVDAAAAESLARRFLANTVIHAVHAGPMHPRRSRWRGPTRRRFARCRSWGWMTRRWSASAAPPTSSSRLRR